VIQWLSGFLPLAERRAVVGAGVRAKAARHLRAVGVAL
jgi:hypothetical protein